MNKFHYNLIPGYQPNKIGGVTLKEAKKSRKDFERYLNRLDKFEKQSRENAKKDKGKAK